MNILIVDDEKNIRNTLLASVAGLGNSAVAAASFTEALVACQNQHFDLILSDYKLSAQETGIDLIGRLKQNGFSGLFIIMTAYSSIENAIAATKAGAYDYLQKPFTTAQLQHTLLKAQDLTKLTQENLRLKYAVGADSELSGLSSQAALDLAAFINRVAPTDHTILLMGESGTGKTQAARLIHRYSKRVNKPFITVTCTALAESVIESELFGHVKGAFTGATTDKTGHIEAASGGTLFLDEIGDLSRPAQSKLLRFLQDHVIERVGSSKEIQVDTRVIAATNKDLALEVETGRFREDLYYRLNALEYPLVSLRHRKEDISVLLKQFLPQNFLLSAAIEKALFDYSWPGNIRELKNVAERLVVLSTGRAPTLDDLPPRVRESKEPRVTAAQFIPQTIEKMERDLIIQTLAHTDNQETAAEILGITTVTLWRKRKLYGLP